jgi:hypothetical protein
VNLRPKRYLSEKVKLKVIYGSGNPRVVIECDVIHPPSSVGRSAYLFLDDEEVTALLLELREAAIVARR